MYIPKINTPEGLKPITVVPNCFLLGAYLSSNISAEDFEIVRYLEAVEDSEYAGAVLRSVLNGSYNFALVYPGAGGVVPEGAKFVCSVPDGALYLVKAPSKS